MTFQQGITTTPQKPQQVAGKRQRKVQAQAFKGSLARWFKLKNLIFFYEVSVLFTKRLIVWWKAWRWKLNIMLYSRRTVTFTRIFMATDHQLLTQH